MTSSHCVSTPEKHHIHLLFLWVWDSWFPLTVPGAVERMAHPGQSEEVVWVICSGTGFLQPTPSSSTVPHRHPQAPVSAWPQPHGLVHSSLGYPQLHAIKVTALRCNVVLLFLHFELRKHRRNINHVQSQLHCLELEGQLWTSSLCPGYGHHALALSSVSTTTGTSWLGQISHVLTKMHLAEHHSQWCPQSFSLLFRRQSKSCQYFMTSSGATLLPSKHNCWLHVYNL